jgi:hypothetical protein
MGSALYAMSPSFSHSVCIDNISLVTWGIAWKFRLASSVLTRIRFSSVQRLSLCIGQASCCMNACQLGAPRPNQQRVMAGSADNRHAFGCLGTTGDITW